MKLERYNDITNPKIYKYPKKMNIAKRPIFNEESNNFLAFTITHKKSKWKAILIIVLAISICLMPLWPYYVKLAIFYFSFYLLIFILAFSLVRFLIYYVCRLAGFEFWILPEIFENDSFIPYYTFEKADDGWTGVIIRIIFVICTILYLSFIYFVPESYEGVGEILL